MVGPGQVVEWWPAPAGSSYATGLASGWLSLALARGALDPQGGDAAGGGRWYPLPVSGDGPDRYLLARDSLPLSGTESAFIDGLLDNLNDPGHPCWQAEGPSEATIWGCDTCQGLSPVSFDQLVSEIYSGTPDTNACVPCTGARGGGRATIE